MRHARSERYEWHLTDRIERLRAIDLDDLNAAWAATVDVLAALFRCEEAEKQPDQEAYFKHRGASDDGRTLAGLIWFRAKVEHHQAELEELVGIPLTYGGVPLMYGGGVATYGEALQFRWPARLKLPNGTKADPNGRDLAYESLVEGADLLGPLDRAARYLLAR